MQQENIHIQKLKLEPLDIIIVKKKKLPWVFGCQKKKTKKNLFSHFLSNICILANVVASFAGVNCLFVFSVVSLTSATICVS